jgi:hypothetical protein
VADQPARSLEDDLRRLAQQLRNANRSARNGANRADRDNDVLKVARRDGQAGAYKDSASRLRSVLHRHGLLLEDES